MKLPSNFKHSYKRISAPPNKVAQICCYKAQSESISRIHHNYVQFLRTLLFISILAVCPAAPHSNGSYLNGKKILKKTSDTCIITVTWTAPCYQLLRLKWVNCDETPRVRRTEVCYIQELEKKLQNTRIERQFWIVHFIVASAFSIRECWYLMLS
jgi:hypothetical protein